MSIDVQRELIVFLNTHGSLLAIGGAHPALVEFVRVLNEESWFVVDGPDVVTRSSRGARPGETIADLIFILLFSKTTKEVRSLIKASEFDLTLPYYCAGFLSIGDGCKCETEDLESLYADDAMHGVCHESPSFVIQAVSFTECAFKCVAEQHGPTLNISAGKTEAVLSLRGKRPSQSKRRSHSWRHCVGGLHPPCALFLQAAWYSCYLYRVPHR